MPSINFPSEFKDIIIKYNNRDFKNALKLLDKIPENKNFKIFKLQLYASIYFLSQKWENSLIYHNKLLSHEDGSFEVYNNLAVTLFHLGKVNIAIKYFIKCIEKNNNIVSPYQNLGMCYVHIGEYQNAIENFVKALTINKRNKNCNILLIDILNYVIPNDETGNYILQLNKQILDFFYNKKITDISKNLDIIAIIEEIEKTLEKENSQIDYNKTEIFRRNRLNLDCKRHFKVFDKFSIIPEYCFGCYKVQINTTNVFQLIKLLFLFNSDFLSNHIRKCMVETRYQVKENYKGFIYCTGLDDAKNICETTKVKLNEFGINYKNIEIKHGCTEYYQKYPDFKKINLNGPQKMLYSETWKKFEKIIDDETPNRDKRVIVESINKINLSDFLIIKNWLNYAELIGDESFKKFYKMKASPNFLNLRLKNQIDFRKNEL